MGSHYQNNTEYRERTKASARARYQNLSPEEREKYRELQVARVRASKYGLTQEQIDAMLAAQSFRCAICETDKPGKKRHGKEVWSIDHDHKTGKIRGILCASCNCALGFAKDDVNLLYAMIDYLLESKTKKTPGHAR